MLGHETLVYETAPGPQRLYAAVHLITIGSQRRLAVEMADGTAVLPLKAEMAARLRDKLKRQPNLRRGPMAATLLADERQHHANRRRGMKA